MHRLFNCSIVLAAACVLAVATPATGHVPAARSAKTCAVPHYPGTGYFTSLTVTRTTCGKGRKLAVAYYNCRTEHGLAGRCHHAVLGYRCTEHRNAIATEIDARVRCRRGAKRIVHTYQQDL